MQRSFCVSSSLVLVLLLACWVAPCSAATKKPNVLLIMIDDLNTSLGCYGNKIVKTPNVDQLASKGIRFDRAYCNYPICNPSRASMLSGLYPAHTKVLGNNTPPRSVMPNTMFLPDLFKKNGYFVAASGKVFHGTFMDSANWDYWENPKDPDDEEGTGAGGEDVADKKRVKPRDRQVGKGENTDVPFSWRATDTKDEQEPDGQIATLAIKLMEENKDKPFFLAVGFHKPHVGHVAPKKYFDIYPPEKMPLPQEPPLGQQGIPKIAFAPKFFPDLADHQKQEIISHYYACTTYMDSQLGRVMEAMDRLKLWDNTIVVFWSDHGWHHGEHGGMWAKVSLMEESARVPFIVVAPGQKSDAVCSRTVQSVDIYPTLVEFCDLKKPSKLDGTSLLPLLKDPSRPWNKPAFCQVNRGRNIGRSIHTEKWTYVEWPDGVAQLYDYTNDPKQLKNLANNPAHKKTMTELSKRIAAEFER
jgi:iduronate 2-sulfatase